MKIIKFNQAAVEHSTHSNYSFALSKYSFKVRLRVDKTDDIDKVSCLYGSLDFFKTSFQQNLSINLVDELYFYYEGVITYTDPRIFYIFEIRLKDGSKYYVSDNGISKSFSYSSYYCFSYSLSYLNEIDIIYNNKVFNGNIFYQIFPDRFCLADEKRIKTILIVVGIH